MFLSVMRFPRFRPGRLILMTEIPHLRYVRSTSFSFIHLCDSNTGNNWETGDCFKTSDYGTPGAFGRTSDCRKYPNFEGHGDCGKFTLLLGIPCELIMRSGDIFNYGFSNYRCKCFYPWHPEYFLEQFLIFEHNFIFKIF